MNNNFQFTEFNKLVDGSADLSSGTVRILSQSALRRPATVQAVFTHVVGDS
jgi:hypothetical protein